jgi:hypothetical protein
MEPVTAISGAVSNIFGGITTMVGNAQRIKEKRNDAIYDSAKFKWFYPPERESKTDNSGTTGILIFMGIMIVGVVLLLVFKKKTGV